MRVQSKPQEYWAFEVGPTTLAAIRSRGLAIRGHWLPPQGRERGSLVLVPDTEAFWAEQGDWLLYRPDLAQWRVVRPAVLARDYVILEPEAASEPSSVATP